MASALVKTISDYRSRALPSAANQQERIPRGIPREAPLRPRNRRRVSTDGSLKSKRNNGAPCRKWRHGLPLDEERERRDGREAYNDVH